MNSYPSSEQFNAILKKAGLTKQVEPYTNCWKDILELMEHLLDRIKHLEEQSIKGKT
jgi:hypothetical protein